MVIKILILFILISASAFARTDQKQALWENVKKSGKEILSAEKFSPELKAKQEEFLKQKETLSELEYQEEEADQLEERVNAHMKFLSERTYHQHYGFFLDWVSWQREASLRSPTEKLPLIVTNQGWCAGGFWGYKSAIYRTFLDGCLLEAWGNVGAEANNATYQQSNVAGHGFKASLGGGRVISPLGAELGLKIPLLYFNQSLDTPDPVHFPGYKIQENEKLSGMISLYSRWPVNKWFVQTEFARILGRDLSFWSIGAGYEF